MLISEPFIMNDSRLKSVVIVVPINQETTASFDFVGSKDFKVGDGSTEKPRNVMSTNQVGQI